MCKGADLPLGFTPHQIITMSWCGILWNPLEIPKGASNSFAGNWSLIPAAAGLNPCKFNLVVIVRIGSLLEPQPADDPGYLPRRSIRFLSEELLVARA